MVYALPVLFCYLVENPRGYPELRFLTHLAGAHPDADSAEIELLDTAGRSREWFQALTPAEGAALMDRQECPSHGVRGAGK